MKQLKLVGKYYTRSKKPSLKIQFFYFTVAFFKSIRIRLMCNGIKGTEVKKLQKNGSKT